MISPSEALQLPTAQLNDEEASAADGLMLLIDEHVRKGMTRAGVDLTTKMTNRNVVAEVNCRLRALGWITEWRPIVEQHRLNAAVQNHTGFQLSLIPSDEAYKEATRSKLI